MNITDPHKIQLAIALHSRIRAIATGQTWDGSESEVVGVLPPYSPEDPQSAAVSQAQISEILNEILDPLRGEIQSCLPSCDGFRGTLQHSTGAVYNWVLYVHPGSRTVQAFHFAEFFAEQIRDGGDRLTETALAASAEIFQAMLAPIYDEVERIGNLKLSDSEKYKRVQAAIAPLYDKIPRTELQKLMFAGLMAHDLGGRYE